MKTFSLLFLTLFGVAVGGRIDNVQDNALGQTYALGAVVAPIGEIAPPLPVTPVVHTAPVAHVSEPKVETPLQTYAQEVPAAAIRNVETVDVTKTITPVITKTTTRRTHSEPALSVGHLQGYSQSAQGPSKTAPVQYNTQYTQYVNPTVGVNGPVTFAGPAIGEGVAIQRAVEVQNVAVAPVAVEPQPIPYAHTHAAAPVAVQHQPIAYPQTYAAAPVAVQHQPIAYAQTYAAAPVAVQHQPIAYPQTYAAAPVPVQHQPIAYAPAHAAAPLAYQHQPIAYAQPQDVAPLPVQHQQIAYAAVPAYLQAHPHLHQKQPALLKAPTYNIGNAGFGGHIVRYHPNQLTPDAPQFPLAYNNFPTPVNGVPQRALLNVGHGYTKYQGTPYAAAAVPAAAAGVALQAFDTSSLLVSSGYEASHPALHGAF